MKFFDCNIYRIIMELMKFFDCNIYRIIMELMKFFDCNIYRIISSSINNVSSIGNNIIIRIRNYFIFFFFVVTFY